MPTLYFRDIQQGAGIGDPIGFIVSSERFGVSYIHWQTRLLEDVPVLSIATSLSKKGASMKRKVALLVATALSLSFAGFAYGALNSNKVVVPSATLAAPITVLSATQDPSSLQNEVVATVGITGVTADSPGLDLVCGNIFDDGVKKVSQCLNVPVGTTQTLKFDLKWSGPIGQLAPGVGLEITDDTSPATAGTGPLLASVDPLQLTVVQIPTLSPAMLAALALLLLGGGFWMQRRRKA